ncbi:hypothetical protein [Spirosoma sp. KUDC1026]|uniref:hypothetical protein n=1 Tax=Spirosoma sp. KUDC1026 TaxID=2745947 RepID=UPI00159B8812|nr:hypothetical protein [Spirosoma sp. KUDC1026]QKZ14551.1 hypothetical protein HU175_18750 [Spirosoma sp. KUDC1026]
MKLDNALVGIQVVLPGQPDPRRIKYNFFGNLEKEDQVDRGIIIYDSETKEEVGIYKNETLGLNLYSNTVFKNVILLAKK